TENNDFGNLVMGHCPIECFLLQCRCPGCMELVHFHNVHDFRSIHIICPDIRPKFVDHEVVGDKRKQGIGSIKADDPVFEPDVGGAVVIHEMGNRSHLSLHLHGIGGQVGMYHDRCTNKFFHRKSI